MVFTLRENSTQDCSAPSDGNIQDSLCIISLHAQNSDIMASLETLASRLEFQIEFTGFKQSLGAQCWFMTYLHLQILSQSVNGV